MPDWFKRSKSPEVPEGAFVKCTGCNAILVTKDFERDNKVCPRCAYHHPLSANERIAMLADEDSFVEFGKDIAATDPLTFPGYAQKLIAGHSEETGRNDGLVTGRASISARPVVLAISDFQWGRLAGTMGSVFGEKFALATDAALSENRPLITFCASGGARMQEGLVSLMQMAKTSHAVAKLRDANIPYIVVLTHPSTGGAVASYASLGDVIFAEPGATVALSGERVAAQAQTQKVPANYRTAEFALEHGMIDRVVHRRDIQSYITRTLLFMQSPSK